MVESTRAVTAITGGAAVTATTAGAGVATVTSGVGLLIVAGAAFLTLDDTTAAEVVEFLAEIRNISSRSDLDGTDDVAERLERDPMINFG